MSEDFIKEYIARATKFPTMSAKPRIVRGMHQGRLAVHIVGSMHGPSAITMNASCIFWDDAWYAVESIDDVLRRIAEYYEMDDECVEALTQCVYELRGIVSKEMNK